MIILDTYLKKRKRNNMIYYIYNEDDKVIDILNFNTKEEIKNYQLKFPKYSLINKEDMTPPEQYYYEDDDFIF